MVSDEVVQDMNIKGRGLNTVIHGGGGGLVARHLPGRLLLARPQFPLGGLLYASPLILLLHRRARLAATVEDREDYQYQQNTRHRYSLR